MLANSVSFQVSQARACECASEITDKIINWDSRGLIKVSGVSTQVNSNHGKMKCTCVAQRNCMKMSEIHQLEMLWLR